MNVSRRRWRYWLSAPTLFHNSGLFTSGVLVPSNRAAEGAGGAPRQLYLLNTHRPENHVTYLAKRLRLPVGIGGSASSTPKRAKYRVASWAVVIPVSCCSAGLVQAQESVTAFEHVSVIPMDRERVLADQTVLVAGDRIVQLGPTKRVPVPAHAVHIDGTSKFLMPGLGDMHMHLRSRYMFQEPNVPDSLIEPGLFLYLANGVTTVRDMWSVPAHLTLRDRIARGELLGPRIYTAHRAYLTDKSLDAWHPPACDRGLDVECLAQVKAAGFDFLKLAGSFYGKDVTVFDSVMARAHRVGLRVVGHVQPNAGLLRTLDARYASIEHLLGYFEYLIGAKHWSAERLNGSGMDAADTLIIDTVGWMQPGYQLDRAKLRTIATATRRAGAWNTPTLSILEAVSRTSPSQYSPTRGRVLARWFELNKPIVKALHDEGAGLLLGTDADDVRGMCPPGFSIHRELALLVAAGLTPYQALETGTRNVAAFLGTLDSTGTVAVGKRADLVLLDSNPLRDIRATAGPAGVMVGGRWLSRAEIDARLDAIPNVPAGDRMASMQEIRRQYWH